MWRVDQTKEEYEVSDKIMQDLNKDLDRQVSHTQSVEKELKATKGKKLIGLITSDINGHLRMWSANLKKYDTGWGRVSGEFVTPEQAMELCGRVPLWEDDEPTPIYQ